MVSNNWIGWIGMMRTAILIFFVFSVCAFRIAADDDGRVQKSQTIIRTGVSIVNVVFTAKDRKGKHVEGLTADDFLIFEDRVPQKIEYFSEPDKNGKGADTPLTIVFLIDTSASVKDKLRYEKATAAEFFRTILRPNKDLVAIIQFDNDVNLVQDFTQNQNDLINALDSLTIGSSTALYDAIYLAAEEKLKNEVGRRVIVVITDGEDMTSRVRKEEAIEVAQRSDVIIYGIGVRGTGYSANFGVLKEFSDETGGMFFSPLAGLNEIQKAFDSIRDELQDQYSLAYRSSNIQKDGKYRSIDLRCKKSGVRIRARKGYFAPRAKPGDSW